MRRQKITDPEMGELLDYFNNVIEPWCKKNNYSLNMAFNFTREFDREKYIILSKLWSTKAGKLFLRTTFKNNKHFTI